MSEKIHQEIPKTLIPEGMHTAERYPKLTLQFMRHSVKEKADKPDNDILLTPEGRQKAAETFDQPMDMRFGHTVGSPRVRTTETAVAAASQDPELTPENLGIGKTRIKEELNYAVDESNEYGRKFNEAYEAGKVISFLVQESDTLAREYKDAVSSTYSEMAGNIASIILKNYEVASRGSRILEQSENPENETNDFSRILATHATIQECFLIKLTEKLKGVDARDELMAVIGDKGFDYNEGFSTEVSVELGEVQVRIKYKKGDFVLNEIVSPEILKQISQEGEELLAEINDEVL